MKSGDRFTYISQNTRPPRKVRRGFVEEILEPDSDAGLREALVRSAQRLTLAYRSLRQLNDDVIAAKWDPPSRETRKRRLKRFTEGELKRAKEGFREACAAYSKRYDRQETHAMLMEAGYEPLITRFRDVILP